jgi:WD40 repeat protein
MLPISVCHLKRGFLLLTVLLAGGCEEPTPEAAPRKEGEFEVTPLGKSPRYRHYLPAQHRLLFHSVGQPPELWDTKQGRRLAFLREQEGDLGDADVSPKGDRLATVNGEIQPGRKLTERLDTLSLCIWDLATGKLIKRHQIKPWEPDIQARPDWRLTCLDERRLLIQMHYQGGGARASFNWLLGILDIDAGRWLKVSSVIKAGESMLLSPDRTRAVTGCHYGIWRDEKGGLARGGRGTTSIVHLIDLKRLEVIATLDDAYARGAQPEWSVWERVWSPDGRWVATVGSDHKVRLWNGTVGKPWCCLEGHKDAILSACFTPDSRSLLTMSEDRTAILWEVATGRPRLTLVGHSTGLNSGVFDVLGRLVVTTSEDRSARLWDLGTGKQLREWPAHESGVRSAEFNADGTEVRTRTARGVERVWSIADGSKLSEKPADHHEDRYGVCQIKEAEGRAEMWVRVAGSSPSPVVRPK